MNEPLAPYTIILGLTYMDGAAGDPAVRRIGKGREQER